MKAHAAYDVVVVGAGLAGLFAGALAAKRGLRTLVIARGVGGTHIGPGTVDVWGYTRAGRLAPRPEAAVEKLRRARHPLALAGLPALRAALDEFKRLCEAGGYPLSGHLGENYYLPTAVGAVRPTCLAPESLAAGDVRRPGELTLARLPGFRDFFADLAAANLAAAGYNARAVPLDLPHAPQNRDAFATDLARLFDDANYRAEVANRWRGQLQGVTRLGLPAVVGLEYAAAARRDLTDRLGLEVFEIPVLPPCPPGMRLFYVLKAALEAAGGQITLGPRVAGWVEDDGAGSGPEPGRVSGVAAETAGGPRRYAARFVVLASGGFRHGGLEAPAKGAIRESVFGLPVRPGKRWFAPLYWDAQPYAKFGVRVDEQMRPATRRGRALYANLFAVGGVLAGADRLAEGCREGIDLATAWKALEAIGEVSK